AYFVIGLGLSHALSVPHPAKPGAEARVAVNLRTAVQLGDLVEPKQGGLAKVLMDQPPHLATCFVAPRERRRLRSERLEVEAQGMRLHLIEGVLDRQASRAERIGAVARIAYRQIEAPIEDSVEPRYRIGGAEAKRC